MFIRFFLNESFLQLSIAECQSTRQRALVFQLLLLITKISTKERDILGHGILAPSIRDMTERGKMVDNLQLNQSIRKIKSIRH